MPKVAISKPRSRKSSRRSVLEPNFEFDGVALTNPSPTELAGRRDKISRLKRRLAQAPDWVSGDQLVDWFARQRGSVTTDEKSQLYAEACSSIFRGLLSGEFVGERKCPHILHNTGVVRIAPKEAEYVRGVWWKGQRDHAADPTIGRDYLREYVRDLWLPTARVRVWLDSINVQHPPWLTPSAVIDQPDSAGKPKRKVPRRDYQNADAPLITEMHTMITGGKAKNPTDAAKAVARKALGPANERSKVERLARHYRTWLEGAQRPGHT